MRSSSDAVQLQVFYQLEVSDGQIFVPLKLHRMQRLCFCKVWQSMASKAVYSVCILCLTGLTVKLTSDICCNMLAQFTLIDNYQFNLNKWMSNEYVTTKHPNILCCLEVGTNHVHLIGQFNVLLSVFHRYKRLHFDMHAGHFVSMYCHTTLVVSVIVVNVLLCGCSVCRISYIIRYNIRVFWCYYTFLSQKGLAE